MVKVQLISNGGRKVDMFAEHQTPREILEYFGVEYANATNSIDGVKLDRADMNKSLKDLGVSGECRISSIVKVDNAAHIDLTGAAAVLVSNVKLEDWKRIQKYAPEALTVIDEETGDPVFKVMTCACTGSVDNNGVCFGNYTNDGGMATVTIILEEKVTDRKQAIKDIAGAGLLALNEIEKKVPGILEEIAKKEAALDELITAK